MVPNEILAKNFDLLIHCCASVNIRRFKRNEIDNEFNKIAITLFLLDTVFVVVDVFFLFAYAFLKSVKFVLVCK